VPPRAFSPDACTVYCPPGCFVSFPPPSSPLPCVLTAATVDTLTPVCPAHGKNDSSHRWP
jgi:hypothetical protein